MTELVLDLFAGPGGADEGIRSAGFTGRLAGVEWDADACATAEAAGHERIPDDVSLLDRAQFAGLDGLWGSPPCQSFSRAGKRGGLADDRGQLVWQPLEWTRVLLPRWVACEQVPEVLPIWRITAAARAGVRREPGGVHAVGGGGRDRSCAVGVAGSGVGGGRVVRVPGRGMDPRGRRRPAERRRPVGAAVDTRQGCGAVDGRHRTRKRHRRAGRGRGVSDLYPAHGDERCLHCGDDIHTWYCLIQTGPHVFEVVCPACYLLATEVPA